MNNHEYLQKVVLECNKWLTENRAMKLNVEMIKAQAVEAMSSDNPIEWKTYRT